METDALDAYLEARDRAQLIRAEWVERGPPMTALGGATGRAETAHPLLAEMRLAEKHAAALREVVRKRHPGAPPVARLGLAQSSSARLRAVRSSGGGENFLPRPERGAQKG